MSKLFNEAATGIVNAPVKVSKAFQEAFIKVDEEGAEAGAFTGSYKQTDLINISVHDPFVPVDVMPENFENQTLKILTHFNNGIQFPSSVFKAVLVLNQSIRLYLVLK